MTGRLATLLHDDVNRSKITVNMPNVLGSAQQYRNDLVAERRKKEAVLSAAFWLHVYDNHYITYRELFRYLTTLEYNPVLRSLTEKHKKGLDYLYKRMSWVRSHPCTALWYVHTCSWSPPLIAHPSHVR